MNRQIIQTSSAPAAIGIYSQGVKYDNLIYTSGQIPINPENNKLVIGDFELEVNQVLTNLDSILVAGGGSLVNVIKLSVYLTDITMFEIVNKVFSDCFPNNPPARTVVQVEALPMNARIEIEAIGYSR